MKYSNKPRHHQPFSGKLDQTSNETTFSQFFVNRSKDLSLFECQDGPNLKRSAAVGGDRKTKIEFVRLTNQIKTLRDSLIMPEALFVKKGCSYFKTREAQLSINKVDSSGDLIMIDDTSVSERQSSTICTNESS